MNRLTQAIWRRFPQRFDPRARSGTPIWAFKWDVCCILDACRVDLMVEACRDVEWLTQAPQSIQSVGSMSPEWISNTFAPEYAEEMARTAYVTGNPFSAKEEYPVGENLPLTEDDAGYLDEAWRSEWVQDDSDLGISTVPPERLTERAIDVWRRREELGIERVVIHYMQPHTPFRSRPEWFVDERDLDIFGEPEKERAVGGERDVWLRLRDGELTRTEVWDAYRDNLRWVLESVGDLRENVTGTIALTSDHGNGMGEDDVWSHPPREFAPAVREVPWVTTEGVDRGTVSPELSASAAGEADVEERLAALGYK